MQFIIVEDREDAKSLFIERFAKKNDLPMLEYCTLPRTGALEVILEVLGPDAKSSTNGVANNIQAQGGIHKICDVTIAYPEGKPLDLFQIVFGSRPACVTHVHYRLFDVKDVSQVTLEYLLHVAQGILISNSYFRFLLRPNHSSSGCIICMQKRKKCWKTFTAPAFSRIKCILPPVQARRRVQMRRRERPAF